MRPPFPGRFHQVHFSGILCQVTCSGKTQGVYPGGVIVLFEKNWDTAHFFFEGVVVQ